MVVSSDYSFLSRNLHPDEYFRSNLLHQEVTPLDVANAFLHLALSSKTTAAMLAVDGSNNLWK